ncbi:MAG: leucyl aminopeptidase [Acidobacteriota bacterium]|jgi:leucyl aminopeptidase|nr:leucyl aminopeptidase [Acidobacteriota bacterium]
MHVVVNREPKLSKIDHLFILLAEGETGAASEYEGVADAIRRAKFSGRSDESITILADGPRKITLLGLGKRDALTIRGVRAALYAIAKTAKKQRDASIAVVFPYIIGKRDAAQTARILADQLSQSDYKYDPYITVKKDQKQSKISAILIPPPGFDNKTAKTIDAEARAIAEGVEIVRDMGNSPGNVMTPTKIGERAQEVANELGIKCTVYGRREIERMKMGGLLAVNRGSAEEPRFIVLEYSPKRAKQHVALVGKGITFDSGGISIKPAEKMEEMKFDMCGAAAVVGTVYAAAKLGLPVKLTGIIASTDNLPSGSAYKPGDIITMMSGKTVEIVNTDAEGRMILGDALHYASQLKPDHILDYATLTGACVVALGSEAAGLFTPHDELAQKLIDAGESVGERLWRLPEWDDYKELIRSEWADMKNSGGRWGGATSAALFLKEFVDCPSWAHLDIAGTAYAEHENAREAKGATGAGVRVTIAFLESLSR